MLKRALITIVLSSIVWGCGASTQHGRETQVVNPDAPVIIDYYAAEVIRPGAVWRVYLHARDRNGDMRDIIARLSQRGRSITGTSSTRIAEEHSGELAGFLSWRTPMDRNLDQNRFTLTVFVRDSRGNRSETVELPFRFTNVPPAEVPEKWQRIANRRLGFMEIRIESSLQRMKRGNSRW